MNERELAWEIQTRFMHQGRLLGNDVLGFVRDQLRFSPSCGDTVHHDHANGTFQHVTFIAVDPRDHRANTWVVAEINKQPRAVMNYEVSKCTCKN